jgi:hypothetical protein
MDSAFEGVCDNLPVIKNSRNIRHTSVAEILVGYAPL